MQSDSESKGEPGSDRPRGGDPAPERSSFPNYVRHLAATAILIYGAWLACFSVAGFPRSMRFDGFLPYLADKPVGEDGYYMLTVAWNLAAGKGITYNFGEATTGIQPLSTIVFSGFAWVVQQADGSKWTFVRVVLFFGVVTLLLFGHLIGRIACRIGPDEERNPLAYTTGFTLAVLNFSMFRQFTYGLETGIYLVLLASVVLYSLRLRTGPAGYRQMLALGLLAGITGLARIDFGVIYFFFLVALLVIWKLRVPQLMLAGVVALLVVSPWFLWVKSVSGHWMPSSGGAQASIITMGSAGARIQAAAAALIAHATPWVFTAEKLILVLGAALSLAAVLAFVLRGSHGRKALAHAWISIRPWGLALLPLVVIYPVVFWAMHFYSRYLSPTLVILLPLLAVGLASGLQELSPRKRAAAFLVLPAAFSVWAFASLHMGRIGNSHVVTAGVVRQYPGVVVGAFQSGVIGYFNENVVNLDGKLDHSALQALRTGRIHEYIEARNIQVLFDWHDVIDETISPEYRKGWEPCEHPVPNGSTICLRKKQPGIAAPAN